nr:oxidase [uncultured Pseudomonas sp.]
MSILSVFHTSSPGQPNKVLTHHDDIAATLAEHGVQFARQPAEVRIRPGTPDDQVLDAWREPLDQLLTANGFSAVSLLNQDGVVESQINLHDEHVHSSDELFAVLSGRAQVALRLGEFVFAVVCEKGDVVHIPAQTRRWIDLGDSPFCLAARLFRDEQGVKAQFTGDPAVREFLRMDEL